MILAIIFAIVAILLLCKLTFNLIIYALPLYVGATAGFALYSGGTGWFVSVFAGIVAAMATLILAHWLLALAKSPLMQTAIGLVFAAPAAFAAYHLVHGIVASSMPSTIWTVAVSGTGAAIFGIFAWTRALSLSPAPAPTPANIESLS
ncbi:hypothetical protein [Sphingorhabdus sp. YGSMI21]|uniref:hypothetical protein n=1 Tax=Sphingorhabdus sp. YGSMI21 TaxID=2077182 RepID=UPI000F4DD811|nr:hypothetical protein [Sphingorhabdus sp. YGSMI21]